MKLKRLQPTRQALISSLVRQLLGVHSPNGAITIKGTRTFVNGQGHAFFLSDYTRACLNSCEISNNGSIQDKTHNETLAHRRGGLSIKIRTIIHIRQVPQKPNRTQQKLNTALEAQLQVEASHNSFKVFI